MNTDRGLLFLALCLGCFYFIFDEFFGTGKITGWADKLTPTIPSLGDIIKDKIIQPIPLKPDKKQAEKDRQTQKDKIDKNKKLDKQTKDEMKKIVDKFYGPQDA